LGAVVVVGVGGEGNGRRVRVNGRRDRIILSTTKVSRAAGRRGELPRGFRDTGDIVSSFVRCVVVLLGDFLWSVEETLLGILDAEIVDPLTKEDSVDVVILQCKLESNEENAVHDDNAKVSKRKEEAKGSR